MTRLENKPNAKYETDMIDTIEDNRLMREFLESFLANEIDVTASDTLIQLGLLAEDSGDALFFFSMAAYIQRDNIIALYNRALVNIKIGDYNAALSDIRHCHEIDLDDPVYEKLEKMLSSLDQVPDC